jgi:hypothetical protein
LEGWPLAEKTIQKPSWVRRWFGGIALKDYLQALPFCIGVLVVPLLPTAGAAYVLQQGRTPLVGMLLLLLTFGFPVLRVKRPRAAWWVGTLVAVGSLFGALVLNVVVGFFFGFYVFLTWALTVPFVILNWKRLRPWTFLFFAAIVAGHLVPIGFAITAACLGACALMGLYFRLPDRDNVPRAPIVVTIVMSLLLARGVLFYFDVGGRAEIKTHPAAVKVFEYTKQRRGWGRILGANPRFLTPTCDGRRYFVGTKFSWKSGLTAIEPGTQKHKLTPMRGGVTDNLVQDCRTGVFFIGNMGANEIYALDEKNPSRVLLRERLEGVRVGLLRLDRSLNRLYVAASNKDFLYVLRAANLADTDRVEFATSVTDLTIDRARQHDVYVVTMGGEVARVQARPIAKAQSVNVNFGKLIYNLALDERNRRLFVTSLFGRQITVLDADTLATVADAPVRRGSRYMQFDDKRGLLYVGNFFLGFVTAYAFDGGKLSEVWSVETGRRVRYLTFDRLRDQLCFTSQAGGYCLDLEKLSPAPAAEPTPEPMAETPAAEEPGEDATPDAE